MSKLFKVLSRHYSSCDKDLKTVLCEKIIKDREKIYKFRKEYGKEALGKFTINMAYGGMRGVVAMVYETSLLNPEKGITFRGFTIPDLIEKLPKAEGSEQPLPEGIFWLLLTSKIPTEEQVCTVTQEWNERGKLPKYVNKILKSFPKDLHPMAQLSATISAMHKESKFAKAYRKHVKKTEYWDSTYEDAMTLIARISVISAKIFQRTYCDEPRDIPIDPAKDFAWNFTSMLGFDDKEFVELMRLYATIHSDHEGGNVSAHTTHVVSSALSDVFLSYAAGINGLAGPLHGLANQEVLMWLKAAKEKLGDDISDDSLKAHVEDTLKAGLVVPGYGHAVLRKTDPRYSSFMDFGKKYMKDDPMFKLCLQTYKVVPDILKATGKVKNPWPNVDAGSGVLLQYYGLTQMEFYTVMFAVSRCIGVMAATIWSRALGFPIERPKSITTRSLIKMFDKKC